MTEKITKRLYGPEYRERWGAGPWNDEPDYIEWVDPMTEYRCVMRRNDMGAWCGYVAIPSTHPAHGITNETDVGDELMCHWGVTYSSCGHPMDFDLENGIVTDLWWFGFDCCHAYDLVPAAEILRRKSPLEQIFGDLKDIIGEVETNERRWVYRDMAYVEGHIQCILEQLVAYAVLNQKDGVEERND